jgi:succinylarginine dihydrolase
MVDEAKLDGLTEVIARHWPEQIASAEIQSPGLIAEVERARRALLDLLDLSELA